MKKYIVCSLKTGLLYILICIFWMILEQLLYEEVQHRVVDDIVSIPILIIIYLMFSYRQKANMITKRRIDFEDSKEFIKDFNHNVVSDDFKKSCKHAGKMFRNKKLK